MRREPGGEFARDLAGLLPDVDAVHTMGPGRYETVVRLGDQDGLPMFTVTHGTVADLEPAAPTAPYLRWIATGLTEAHGWNAQQVVDYLQAAPGVQQGLDARRADGPAYRLMAMQVAVDCLVGSLSEVAVRVILARGLVPALA